MTQSTKSSEVTKPSDRSVDEGLAPVASAADQLAIANERIADLEQMHRWFISSAEIIAALGDFQSSINLGMNPEIILRDARNYIAQLLPVKALGFMSAENPESNFEFVETTQVEHRTLLETEVERAVTDGTFGWAVQQNRAVLTPLHDRERESLVLHVIATRSRVWGMCVMIVDAHGEALADVSLQLVSVILMNAANALESHRLNALVLNYNRDLEEAVALRTSELMQARKAAEAASDAKSDFLANVSHELRTPLNAIIGYTEILSDEIGEENAGHHWLEDLQKVYKSSKYLLELIDDILDISRIESGHVEIVHEPFHLGNLLRHLISSIRPMAGEQKNTIELESDVDPEIIFSDRLRFRQSVLNLLSNACKFTHEGRITVRAEDCQINGRRWLMVSVSDTGIGVNADKLESIFEPFKQAERAHIKRYKGNGLGLAITKRLCVMLGGDVDVESQRGKGSTFTIRVPVDAV